MTRPFLWLHARRKRVNAWAVRIVSFYFGYKILDHEIYSAKTTDPILVFLGLWLCGVAPATFFDSMRKANEALRSATDTSDDAKNLTPADTHKEIADAPPPDRLTD